jgi:predicted dehydrogenase
MAALAAITPRAALITDDEAFLDELLKSSPIEPTTVILCTPDPRGSSTESDSRYFEVSLSESEWFLRLNPELHVALPPSSELCISAPLTLTKPHIETDRSQDVAWVNIAMADRTVASITTTSRVTLIIVGLPIVALNTTNRELLHALLSLVPHPQRRSRSSHSETLGLAVVGYGPYGGMGYFHGSAATTVGGLSFVAAVDPSDERRHQASLDFPQIATYDSIDKLAHDDSVDIVVIATPPSSHFELAMAMLNASKHVVVEKPLCLTTAEARALIQTAEDRNLVLTVNQNRRWDQDYRTIKLLIEAGALGEVFNIETFVGGFEHPCRAWHSDETVSGGIAYDWGAHHIDWILQLYGAPPTSVQVHGHKRKWFEVTNLDQIRITMTFDDGREATFFQSEIAAFRKPKFYIQGTKATLVGEYRPITVESVGPVHGYTHETFHHAEAPARLSLGTYEGVRGISVTEVPLVAPDRFGLHRNLADHLILGSPLEVNASDVCEVISILEEAHVASKLPPSSSTPA